MKTIKASELKQWFASIPDDADVSFGPSEGNNLGTFTICRVKQLAEKLYNVEFNEPFALLFNSKPPEDVTIRVV